MSNLNETRCLLSAVSSTDQRNTLSLNLNKDGVLQNASAPSLICNEISAFFTTTSLPYIGYGCDFF